MTRAAIYVRISNDRTGKAAGVSRQEADCRELCARLGWDVADVYRDNDLTAMNRRKPRPEWLRLLRDLEAGAIGAVTAWHPDRLYRRNADLEELVDVVEGRGVAVATATAGSIDLSTASGRMVARILGATAQAEVEHLVERVREKVEELARNGEVGGGGTRPYGYEADRVTVREDERAVVVEAAGRVLAGDGVRRIVRDLNERDVRTVTGTRWTATVLRRVLTAPRTAGLRELRGEVVGEAVWDGLLDRETWERVRAELDRRHNNPSRPRDYVLTGLLRCGRCDAKMVARPKADRRRQYVCARDHGGCGKLASLAEPLEDEVRDRVVARLDAPGLAEALRREADRDDPVRELVDELRDVEERRRQDDEDEAWGRIPRATWLTRKAVYDEREARARRALESHRDRALLADLPTSDERLLAAWEDVWGLDRKRAFLDLLVERVDLGPAVRGRNRFDPGRVSVRWKV